jgi:hypothetical protein
MEEVARLGDFGKTVLVLDPRHDLVQNNERRDSPNTPSIYTRLAGACM